MSLDVYLEVMQPVAVFDSNITHNLNKMAAQVKVNDTLTLYDILWRADEHGFTKASEIAELLDYGWNVLLSDPEKFKEYNPANGWGIYEQLCNFVYEYRNACWNHPEAVIRISR
jgi:hypothetical protein